MFRKLSRFYQYPFSKKMLFFEGVFYSFIFKILIKTIPFRWTKALFGLKPYQSNTLHAIDILVQTPTIKNVGQIIKSVQNNVPWHNTCLVEALTGKFLLKKQNVETVIVMAVRKENDELKAHAWLLCLENPQSEQWGILTGYEQKAGHTPVGYII
jgi:hypothetical protein